MATLKKQKTLTPANWKAAYAQLGAADATLAHWASLYPKERIKSRGNPYETLLRSIVGQQISVKAADAVWARFAQAVPSLLPKDVLKAKTEKLRAAGLSERKVEYVKDLAQHILNGTVRPEEWPTMLDDDIIAQLVAVRGIGVWTAQMVLMFNCLRLDVLPLDDLGLQKAMRLHYGLETKAQMREYAEKHWAGNKSVATWLMWRSLDPVPVSY